MMEIAAQQEKASNHLASSMKLYKNIEEKCSELKIRARAEHDEAEGTKRMAENKLASARYIHVIHVHML